MTAVAAAHPLPSLLPLLPLLSSTRRRRRQGGALSRRTRTPTFGIGTTIGEGHEGYLSNGTGPQTRCLASNSWRNTGMRRAAQQVAHGVLPPLWLPAEAAQSPQNRFAASIPSRIHEMELAANAAFSKKPTLEYQANTPAFQSTPCQRVWARAFSGGSPAPLKQQGLATSNISNPCFHSSSNVHSLYERRQRFLCSASTNGKVSRIAWYSS